MEEPYETLLGQYKDHPVVGKWLTKDIPDWREIWSEAMPSLSSGERLMFQVALTFYNGHPDFRFADIFNVDHSNQERILYALALRIEPGATTEP